MLLVLYPLFLFSQDYVEIKTSDLPKGVHEYVTSNMPGGVIARAVSGTEQGQTVYAAVIEFRGNKRVMVFDKEGSFLRKADNLSSSASESPAMSNTANPKSASAPESGSGAMPMQPVEEKSLPEPIRKFLKENHTTYTILEAKIVPLSESPMFQIILRDSKTDNNYLFNARGDLMKKRSYELDKSPFVGQFPLKR